MSTKPEMPSHETVAEIIWPEDAAESRGFARGIEAAAKWHEEQAAIWAGWADGHRKDPLTHGGSPAHVADGFAQSHREDAAAIRSLAKGETR